MATAIIMPRQGNTVESCIVSKWHKQKGDAIAVGDILFTYETDKATFDEEASVAGTLLEIFFEEDEDVPVLTNMCVIGEEGEDVSGFTPDGASESEKSAEEEKAEEPVTVETVAVKTATPTDGITKISPRAKKLAEKAGLDIAYATATGPNGRIIERDIIELEKSGPAITKAAEASYVSGTAYMGSGIGERITASDIEKGGTVAVAVDANFVEFEDEKLPNIRKVIARAMHNSLSSMAQLTINMSFDASAIMKFRKGVKAKGEELGLPNITLGDMVVYITAKTLLKHKDLNAHFTDNTIRRFNTVHMGVAVDTDRGLMVPTLFNSDRMTLAQISANTKDIAGQSKSGTINPDLLQGGTFTITNLGTMGVESFTPVNNPPQTAILGVCGITTRVKEVNGNITTYPSMGLSLTINHMAVDGAPAARFLKELCNNLEMFEVMLLA
ncbi:MAG: 2-oxo acid dehydrogenase subunit E2 [Clostridiales bacterium]|nr:2-oxo acid dehydrogenase subunit E2 [Clostridiales bacterium]